MEVLITHSRPRPAFPLVSNNFLTINQPYERTITSNAIFAWFNLSKNVQRFVHLPPHDLWCGTQSAENVVEHLNRKQKFC
jgi:hypothetical protein